MNDVSAMLEDPQYVAKLLKRMEAKSVLAEKRVWGLPKRCRIWTGAKNGRGYGQISIGPRGGHHTVQTTRVSYHYHVDLSLPIMCGKRPELVIDHLCRHILCFEPLHLQAVPQRKNVILGLVSDLNDNKSSQYVGVCWHKDSKQWLSQGWINGKHYYFGFYRTELEAARAYRNALRNI